VGVDQRLLAHPVARDEEPTAAAVPQGEGEHAVQVADAVDAVLLVEVRDDLGVAVGGEPVAARPQVPPQLSPLSTTTTERSSL
jgi:hypothetical protein